MATTAQPVAEVCAQAKRAARELATLDTATKNAALEAMAGALEQRKHEIIEANGRDMEAGQEAGLHSGLLDRLKLDEERIAGIARDVRSIAALPDPVGETIEGHRLENGLDVRRVRVPLGVVAVVYEARPNVTVDCAALCLKSGNAIVLRVPRRHRIRTRCSRRPWPVRSSGPEFPRARSRSSAGATATSCVKLATQDGVVDLIIPRGERVSRTPFKEHATVPVLYASAGVCHVLVDSSADSGMTQSRDALYVGPPSSGSWGHGVVQIFERISVDSSSRFSFADGYAAGAKISWSGEAFVYSKFSP